MAPLHSDSRVRPPRIDRTKVSPSLLRVFVRTGSHHPDADYTVDRLPPPSAELDLYIWRDSSLREILHLARDALPALRDAPTAKYSLRLVYFDQHAARFTSAALALVPVRDLLAPVPAHAPPPGPPARLDRTLADAKYVVGDFLDLAFLPTGADLAAPAPAPAPATAPGARARGDTWAPAPGGPRRSGPGGAPGMNPGPGPGLGVGGGGAGGGPPRRGGGPPPTDNGWGAGAGAGAGAGQRRRNDGGGMGAPARGGFEGRDRPPHIHAPARRRSSRSRSPGARRRAGSPPPPRRGRPDDDDVRMRD